MRTREDIEKEIAEIDADERLHYPPANIFVNAPLALIQTQLSSRIAALRWVLETTKETS